MAKNFLDQEEDVKSLSFADGFRFGFGFFIAWLLGSSILALVVSGVLVALGRLHN
jgi:hypothetical protein